jgi:hypothetical protein
MSFSREQKIKVNKYGKWWTGIIKDIGFNNEYRVEYDMPGPEGYNVLREYVPAQFIRVAEANMPSYMTAPAAMPRIAPALPAASEQFPINTFVEVLRKDGTINKGVISNIENGSYSVVFKDIRDYESGISKDRIRLPVKGAVEARPAAPVAMEVSEPPQSSIPVDVTVSPPMAYRSCSDFLFPLEYLTKCEELRKTMWRKIIGGLGATCGYTGPGIGILLLLFERNNIKDLETLKEFLRINSTIYGKNFNEAFRRFTAVVNETTGNFLDLCDVTPVTQTTNGLKGLIKEEEATRGQGKVSLVNTNTLVKGVNVISFKARTYGSCTFHHSMIYVVPGEDMCFILDSWFDNFTQTCRPPTCRQFTLSEVKNALIRLNSQNCTAADAYLIFAKYFLAANAFLNMVKADNLDNSFYVYVLNQEYIKSIFTECERMMIGVLKTNFGGYIRKKKKLKTRKSRSRKSRSRKSRSRKSRFRLKK